MKIGNYLFIFYILSLVIIFISILLSSLLYEINIHSWKHAINCDEINGFAWNSPMLIPEEIKENVTRCYAPYVNGSSNGIKLFENKKYIGEKYFGKYKFGSFNRFEYLIHHYHKV